LFHDENQDSVIEIFSGTFWEAEMIRSLLENAEIDSFLKNNVVTSYAFEPTPAGEVKVMITGADFERAKEIVASYYKNLKE
jgi:hypothetical protein